MERVGLFEKKVFPFFGYYPWECSACRKRVLLKTRGQKVRVRRPDRPGMFSRE